MNISACRIRVWATLGRRPLPRSHRFRLRRHRTFSTDLPTSSMDDDDEKPFDIAYSPVNAYQMNQYVVACTKTKQAVIIDCGASTHEELNVFLKWMETKKYQLTAVWQTHAHLDHVAGLGLLQEALGGSGDVPLYLHERERHLYEAFDTTKKHLGFAVEGNYPMPPADSLVYFNHHNKTTLKLGELTFTIIPTPGHSPGHVGFYEPTSHLFFGGDLIMKGSIGRTDLPTSNHQDMMDSLRRVSRELDEPTFIYPGHGLSTTMQYELLTNPFLQPIYFNKYIRCAKSFKDGSS